MIKKILIILMLLINTFLVHAEGVDQEYGRKNFWWTNSYDHFMSYFGVEKSYALVVGVGQYNNKIFSNLPSEKDATRIKNYLINKAGFDSVRLITGDKVTRERIYSLMASYSKILTKKDQFLFYWSGHGVTQGQMRRKQGYLAIKTSSKNPATMLSMQNISSWDNNFKAKQTLYLLDACFSGIAASKAMSINQEQTIKRISRPSRQILTAGLENEKTIAIQDMDGGVFTRALLDGLDGHADTNKGIFIKDGIVTARELELYVRKRVDHERRRVGWKNPITPVLYNFSQFEGDFYFISDKKTLSINTLNKNFQVKKEVIATGVKINNNHMKANDLFFGRYIVHDDETVTDTKTHLMWKMCSEGQKGVNCAGKPKVYLWHSPSVITRMKTYFSSKSFAGYNDWRIPTVKEIKSLIYCSNGVYDKKYGGCGGSNEKGIYPRIPKINLNVFPNIGVYQGNVGTSSPYASSSLGSYYVGFGDFHADGADGKLSHVYVRLVRSIRASDAPK